MDDKEYEAGVNAVADDPCEAFETITRLTAALEAVQQENTRIRAALASSKDPCVYCSLPADEWAKCKDGFPGCARADDAMGCPRLEAQLEFEELRTKLAEAMEALDLMASCFQPFAARPIGAPGSESRKLQDEQIKAHRRAAAVLAKITANQTEGDPT